MRGNIWEISVLGVGLALLTLILPQSSGAAGVTGAIAGLFGALTPVIGLLFFVVIMTGVGKFVFGTGGSF